MTIQRTLRKKTQLSPHLAIANIENYRHHLASSCSLAVFSSSSRDFADLCSIEHTVDTNPAPFDMVNMPLYYKVWAPAQVVTLISEPEISMVGPHQF